MKIEPKTERLKKQAVEIDRLQKKLDIPLAEMAIRTGLKPETMRKVAHGYQPASSRVLLALRNLVATKPVFPLKGPVGPKGRRIPVVSWAAAGAAHDYCDLAGQIDEYIDSDLKDNGAFALIVEGDSMNPRIEAGDKVVVSPNSEPRNGDIVVARLQNEGILVKLYKRTGAEGKSVKLESLNPLYKAQVFPQTAFLWIYPVVELRGRLRKV